MNIREIKQAISLTQAVLARVEEAVGEDVYFRSSDPRVKDLLSQLPIGEQSAQALRFVAGHFKDSDVRAGLGVNAGNEQRVYTRLHCLNTALEKPFHPRKRLIFW